MNQDTYSDECFHKMHSECNYEDCACLCHLRELLDECEYERITEGLERMAS